jgi:hypothetical protein
VQVSEAKKEWEDLECLGVESSQQYLSVCDVWKDSVHKMVTKLEYQTPIYLQAYTQVHTEFLHCIDNLFGTCYLWQKQYFDRLGIDKRVISAYGELYNSWVDQCMQALDAYANYKKLQADMAVNAMKVGNDMLHSWIDMYGRIMSSWNKWLQP